MFHDTSPETVCSPNDGIYILPPHLKMHEFMVELTQNKENFLETKNTRKYEAERVSKL